MLNTKWTAHDRESLQTFFNQGLTDEQIGVKLGRSRKAISIARSKAGAVRFHIIREKGKRVGRRAKPVRGKMPAGSQLYMDGLLPDNATAISQIKKVRKAFDEVFPGVATYGRKRLEGNEEFDPGPTIQKTILSDVGLVGTINIYNHDGETDITITNISPRNAVQIMATIISKLI